MYTSLAASMNMSIKWYVKRVYYRIGRDDLLGCCILGEESPTAEGREQWRDAFAASSVVSPQTANNTLLEPTATSNCSSSNNKCLAKGQLSSTSSSSQHQPPPLRLKPIGKWHSLLAEVPEDFRKISKKWNIIQMLIHAWNKFHIDTMFTVKTYLSSAHFICRCLCNAQRSLIWYYANMSENIWQLMFGMASMELLVNS